VSWLPVRLGAALQVCCAVPAIDRFVAPPDAAAEAARKEQAETIAKRFESGEMETALQRVIDSINGPGAWASSSEATQSMFRDNAWTIVGVMREDASRVSCAEFGALQMPVLLVHGERTSPRFLRIVGEASKCLPNASAATIPRAGHPSPLMNPTAFKEAVTTFLQP